MSYEYVANATSSLRAQYMLLAGNEGFWKSIEDGTLRAIRKSHQLAAQKTHCTIDELIDVGENMLRRNDEFSLPITTEAEIEFLMKVLVNNRAWEAGTFDAE